MFSHTQTQKHPKPSFDSAVLCGTFSPCFSRVDNHVACEWQLWQFLI
jgi:hypothetical protein